MLQVELAVGVVVEEEELDQDGGGLRVLDDIEATAVFDSSVLVAEGGHAAADFGRCGVFLASPCPALHPAAFMALGGITVDGEEELRAAGVDQLADLLEVGAWVVALSTVEVWTVCPRFFNLGIRAATTARVMSLSWKPL